MTIYGLPQPANPQGAPSHSAQHSDSIKAYAEGVRPTETAADNATRLQAVLDEALTVAVVLPYGTISYDTTLQLNPSQLMFGYGGSTLSTLLSYTGADATNGIEMKNPVSQPSRIWLEGFRLNDARTAPTSGTGIYLDRIKNMCRLHRLTVGWGQTDDAIGVYAPTSSSSVECIHISNTWVGGMRYGINIAELDNNCRIDHVMGDAVSPNTKTALIHLGHVTNGQGVVSISAVKLETNQGCHLLDIGSSFSSTVVADSLIMRSNTTLSGGDVVHLASEAGDYVFSGLASQATGLGTAAAANLINDTAAGIVYGTGAKTLPFQVIRKNSGGGSGFTGGVAIPSDLPLPATAPVDTMMYDTRLDMLWTYDVDGVRGVELG